MLPGSGGLLRWDSPAAGALSVALLPPTGSIVITCDVDNGPGKENKQIKCKGKIHMVSQNCKS